MSLATAPTELTTGLTDAVLALECLVVLVWLRRAAPGESLRLRLRLWSWVFGLMAFASALGAVAHGLALPADVVEALWIPLYLGLGVLVALFGVAALHDWRGPALTARLVPWAVATGAAFYGVTELFAGAFIVFVAFEAVVMLAALVIYVQLAATRRRPGAGIVALGIVLSLLAVALQASGAAVAALALDHNGLFHIAQMVATAVLAAGVARGMRRTPGQPAGAPEKRAWQR